ncbi:MAG: putative DNA binding domain-containing protein [Treponema sp.]|nr:putative DNA binding domain-containing protein [Treponema sp.]
MKRAENQTTEFKREYTDTIKKTVIAFANSNGGTLYVGIEDDGRIAGLDNPDDTFLKISNAIRSAIKPDITLFIEYALETIEGATILKIQVHKGSARPYYLGEKGIRPEGVFVRQGASSVPASETAILKMIKETDGEKYETIRSLNQELSFKDTAREFNARGLEFGERQMGSLKIARPDGIYTNLGLLLSDQCVHTIKLAVFEGIKKEVFKDRREFSGSLLKQLTGAYAFIDMHNHTHSEVKGLYRVDARDYPEDALREALLNALIHRDYAFSGSILISIFEDRMEFVSIGGLVRGISLDDIMLGVSITRNESLANIFYRLKLVEAYGTGVPTIMRSYAGAAQMPRIEATDNAFKITLPNRNTAHTGFFYQHGEKDIEPRAVFDSNGGPAEYDYMIINLLKKQPVITRKDVEALLSLSQAMAVRTLKSLKDRGIIRAIGGGKKTRYIMADSARMEGFEKRRP